MFLHVSLLRKQPWWQVFTQRGHLRPMAEAAGRCHTKWCLPQQRRSTALVPRWGTLVCPRRFFPWGWETHEEGSGLSRSPVQGAEGCQLWGFAVALGPWPLEGICEEGAAAACQLSSASLCGKRNGRKRKVNSESC